MSIPYVVYRVQSSRGARGREGAPGGRSRRKGRKDRYIFHTMIVWNIRSAASLFSPGGYFAEKSLR
eukprot:2568048-Pyramimonas_sp.AAC.1